jgi:hypothetical protein
MPAPRFADNELIETRALPNGAATVNGAAIEVGCGTPDDFPVNCEFKIAAPAVGNSVFADGGTIKYSIVTDDVNTFDSDIVATLLPDVLTQTAAGGAGAAAADWQGRIPISGVRKYVGLKIVKSNSGNASTLDATFSLLV